MLRCWKMICGYCVAALVTCVLSADDKTPAAVLAGGVEPVSPAGPAVAAPALSITQHQATIAGQQVTYQVTAGSLPLKTDTGQDTAQVFFVAYTRTDAKHSRARPISYYTATIQLLYREYEKRTF